ncbi:MAG: DUF4286 family protein [Nitrospinota bacterium]
MAGEFSTILVTTVDIDPAAEERFNRWYNEKHLPEVMGCPGFKSARRFRAAYGEPKYIAIYELDSEEALRTPEMQAVRGWGEMFPFVRNFHERIYHKFHEILKG